MGYVDTAISMAGWGIAYFAERLSLRAVLFYPEYKNGYRHLQKKHLKQWQKFNADIRPLKKPTRRQINIYQASRVFYADFPMGKMLPNGLVFNETIEAVAKEAQGAIQQMKPATIVTSVGSGVMMAGILKGASLSDYKIPLIVGVLVNKKQSIEWTDKKVTSLSCLSPRDVEPLLGVSLRKVVGRMEIIKGSYLYEETADCKTAPFPCNPYYDLKAYEYMMDNLPKLPKPILFWNIGA